jgi:hypothetical protein
VGDYLLPLRDGQAKVVAAMQKTGAAADCDTLTTAEAKDLPCPLPFAVTYRSGQVIVAGSQSYVIAVQVSAR